MAEVIGTIRVVHEYGRGAAGPLAAGHLAAGGAGLLGPAGAAGAGGLLGATGGAAGISGAARAAGAARTGLFSRGFDPRPYWKMRAAGASGPAIKQAMEANWPAGGYVPTATGRVTPGAMPGFFGAFREVSRPEAERPRVRWYHRGWQRRARAAGWDPSRAPVPKYSMRVMNLGEFGERVKGMAQRGMKGLSQIGKWFSGAGLTPQKLASIGKFFKKLGESTGLIGGPLGALVSRVGAIAPGAAAVGLAGKAMRDVRRARAAGGAFQQRLAAGEGLGTGYAASQRLTEERRGRYAVQLAGAGTYAGQRGLLEERMKRERIRREPGIIAQEWSGFGADLTMGIERVKGWFYKEADPALEKARRDWNRQWAAGKQAKSWGAMRDLQKLREDPYYRALEEMKKQRPDLFGDSRRGAIAVSGQYGLAGATATATAARLSKEDLKNEMDRVLYSIQQSQGMGP